jgi:hypothetical protein
LGTFYLLGIFSAPEALSGKGDENPWKKFPTKKEGFPGKSAKEERFKKEVKK